MYLLNFVERDFCLQLWLRPTRLIWHNYISTNYKWWQSWALWSCNALIFALLQLLLYKDFQTIVAFSQMLFFTKAILFFHALIGKRDTSKRYRRWAMFVLEMYICLFQLFVSHLGPFLYYVCTFLDFFWSPHPALTVPNVINNSIAFFYTYTPRPFDDVIMGWSPCTVCSIYISIVYTCPIWQKFC